MQEGIEGRLSREAAVTTHLLLHLKLIDDRRQLAEDLVGFLVILELSGDQLGEVAKWFRRIEDLIGHRKSQSLRSA